KTPRGDPAARLLIHRLPRREVGRQPAPWRARVHDVAHGVEHLAQLMSPLGCRLGPPAQVRGDELPFFVADIAGIRASVHPPILRAWRCWFITRSKASPGLT